MASLRFPISLDAFDSKPSLPSLSTYLHANAGPRPFKTNPPLRASKNLRNPNTQKLTSAAKTISPPNTEKLNTDVVDLANLGSLELSTDQCNVILKRLENDDAAKTLSFFSWMRSAGKVERNADAYNAAIRALCKSLDWEGAEKLVQEMRASFGSEMSYRVFNTVIYACSKRGLVGLGAKWFRLMLEYGVVPNAATFGMLMGLYRKGWNVDEAEFAISKMRQFGVVCEAANSSMITIYTRMGLYEKAEGVVELMEKEGLVLNFENWLVILNLFCQQGKMGEAEGVLVSMEEAGFCANVIAFNTMITGYGKASKMDAAQGLFLRMKEEGVVGLDPDETTYRSMVEGWGRAGNYEQARWHYKELRRLGYKPSSSNLYTMMKLQAEHGDEEGAVGTLDDMLHCGCHCSSVIGTVLRVYESVGKINKVPFLLKGSLYQHVLVSQGSCSTVVMAYVKHGLVEDALRVLGDKKWQDRHYEDNLYHLLICSCKEGGLLQDAVRIYNQMPKSVDKPNQHIMCTMIDIYSVMGLFKEAEMLYLKLKSSGVSLDMIAFSIVVRMYVKSGSLEDACSVLDAIEKRPDIVPDQFLLRDMLRIYQRCNMVDKLAGMYYKISKDRVNWDQELYSCVLNCCSQALPVDELSRLFDEMLQRGFAPNTITYNVMLDVFGKAKLFRKVRRLYFMAKKQGLVDVITYNTIIAAYGKNKDFKNMSSTVQKMQFDGFSVSLEAYNSMLNAYGKDGQVETFRSVLQQMKESNCASDHYTYNTMINIYGEQGWIEEVGGVLAELKEYGLRPDLCSYNTLIKAYGIAGMVEDAVGLIKEMRKNGIEPDKKTYINLITALRRNDKFLEAVKWSLWMKQLKL
ncbi:pentatricopeptide repeat-containing protein At4g30825, chloroplastic [Lotus japonicus]|uniref:pentatricopeptide repeat-containing protein At4g30825, chloroplastic n=1 Tax=Lotus japonicus TaxID=34305 RepID=UPI00258909CB|nr:pentatricopeptide repeat-containing protein At4g30825, chloroplastic [Lotus japonicus]